MLWDASEADLQTRLEMAASTDAAATAAGVDGTITELDVHDLRWPTSKSLDGSDAMHKDPGKSLVTRGVARGGVLFRREKEMRDGSPFRSVASISFSLGSWAGEAALLGRAREEVRSGGRECD